MNTPQPPCPANEYHQAHVVLLLESFQRLLGRPLLPNLNAACLGQEVFFADFALLSHDTQSDPIFNYANKTALELFELSWPELIVMPSSLSAEPGKQEERERSLAQVTYDGYIDNYSGVRVSKNGRRFLIQRAVVWNVVDRQGRYHGQAATFKDWEQLS